VEASPSSEPFLGVLLLLLGFVLLCFMRRAKLGLASSAGDKPD